MKEILICYFRKPSVRAVVESDLDEAMRKLLQYQASVEYATAMRDMLANRIERLKEQLKRCQ